MMDKLQGWWRGISPREQRLVAVGGCALLIGLCYWVIWQPVANRIDERQRQVANQQQTRYLAMGVGQRRQRAGRGLVDRIQTHGLAVADHVQLVMVLRRQKAVGFAENIHGAGHIQ